MNEQTLYAMLHVAGGFLVRAWIAIGPLVGVLIGARLNQSWQRKRWLLESKQTEYRELISRLSESVHCIVKNWAGITGQQREEARNAVMAGMSVIEDRILIHKQIVAQNVAARWQLVIAEEKDIEKVRVRWNDLHSALIKIAQEDLGLED
jgi:ElaB/YqjD/DUF883 family membrane-anchored ribosome-binding protein